LWQKFPNLLKKYRDFFENFPKTIVTLEEEAYEIAKIFGRIEKI
jgi:hypothetical protein